jgi:hypothetical protein
MPIPSSATVSRTPSRSAAIRSESHQHNLYEKLGVSDRAAAVAEAMRRGLLE